MSLAARPLESLPPDAAGPRDPGALLRVLLESRQRWQDFALIAADLLFETDAKGRVTFLAPDEVLGFDSASLLGQPLHEILPLPASLSLARPMRRLRVWTRRADSNELCLEVSAEPLPGGGVRGLGVDVTLEARESQATAELLRRATELDAILAVARDEDPGADAIAGALARLPQAMGADGAVLVRREGGTRPEARIAEVGLPPDWPEALLAALAAGTDWRGRAQGGEPCALLHHRPSTIDGNALIVWRSPSARPFDHEETVVLGSLAGVLGGLAQRRLLERRLEDLARRDPLTDLLNRRAFLDDVTPRIEAGRGGALLFCDLDLFKEVNDRHGHATGDLVLQMVAETLRLEVRAHDLVARFGGDEFVLWLDGVGPEVAAERAEHLCRQVAVRLGARLPAPAPTLSAGVTLRAPRQEIAIEELLARADAALYAAKQAGRARWRMAG
jgi:diguanylate cyclase (GGDEF)-like protein